MQKMTMGMVLILLVGCGDNKVNLGDDTAQTLGDCEVTLIGAEPADGAVDVGLTTTVVFTLSEADATATIETDIAGTTTNDGLTVTFTPDAPLESATAYTVTLNYCAGSESTTFNTVAGFADKVDQKTYALELQKASIDQPAGVGGLISDQLPEYILMQVLSADSSSIQFMGALAIDGSDPIEQDTCTATLPFPSADFSGQPAFSVGPQDTVLAVGGYSATLYSMELAANFTADGSAIENGTLNGQLDMREVAELLGYSPDTACSLLSAFGAPCEACPSDGGAYCVTIVASNLNGSVVDGLSLVEVTENCP